MYNYMNKRTIIRGLQGDVAFDLSLDLWKDFSQLRGRRASLVAACNARDQGSIPGRQDPLEKEMATHSSALAWKIPWME